MNQLFRPSSLIERQIAEFKATLPPGLTGPPPDDFAAQLEWNCWQNHLQELDTEWEASVDHEMAGSDIQLALDGDPVKGHAIHIGFLSTVLGKVQSLVNALAQASEQRATERGSIPNRIMEEYRLLFDGSFASSFGVKLRVPSPTELGRDRTSDIAPVVDQFCSLFNPDLDQTELSRALAQPRVRRHYRDLIDGIAKQGAVMKVRTPRIKKGFRFSSPQARDRAEWLDSWVVDLSTLEIEGILVGGSLNGNRFEIQTDDELYKGSISATARDQMQQIKLGDRVKATIEETTLTAEDVSGEAKITHFLESIDPVA